MSNIKAATLEGGVLLNGSGTANRTAPTTEGPENRLQEKERRLVRNGILWTVIPVFLLMAGLMWGFSTVDEEKLTGAATVDDVSVELANVYKAATNAGILQTHDTNPVAMAAWLADNGLGFVKVLDLSDSGMVFQGARALAMPGGSWAMLQYAGAQVGRADLLVVVSPKGNVGVPHEAVEGKINGIQVFTDRVHSIGVTYINGPRLDWMLVSTDDEAMLAESAKALIDQLT